MMMIVIMMMKTIMMIIKLRIMTIITMNYYKLKTYSGVTTQKIKKRKKTEHSTKQPRDTLTNPRRRAPNSCLVKIINKSINSRKSLELIRRPVNPVLY